MHSVSSLDTCCYCLTAPVMQKMHVRGILVCFFFFLFYKVLFGKAKVMTNTHNRSFFFNQVISSVQSLSPVQLFEIPWTAACQASLSITNSHRVGDAIQPSHLLSSSSSAAFNLSQHQGLFK